MCDVRCAMCGTYWESLKNAKTPRCQDAKKRIQYGESSLKNQMLKSRHASGFGRRHSVRSSVATRFCLPWRLGILASWRYPGFSEPPLIKEELGYACLHIEYRTSNIEHSLESPPTSSRSPTSRPDELRHILTTAAGFEGVSTRSVKKVPALRGRVVVNLFFEDSTRTRASFSLAASRLSADVLDFSAKGSSVLQGRDPDRHRPQHRGDGDRRHRAAARAQRGRGAPRPQRAMQRHQRRRRAARAPHPGVARPLYHRPPPGTRW